MFKKKPQIKNLSPLRSSDRRKLADQIILEFHVEVPASQTADGEKDGEVSESSMTPTLTSIRSSLVPENCLSARFTTHAGAEAKLVSGTLYVGAHPAQEERILWIQMGQKEPRLYPTIYTLWQNPGLVPLLHTQGLVVDKLRTGADLMTPGLTRGPPFPQRATKNAIVAVASLERPSVPLVVGVCEIDVSKLEKVQGAKGHAVRGEHWAGDEIWAWSSGAAGGRDAPDHLDGWDNSTATEQIERSVKDLDMDGGEDVHEGGVSLDVPTSSGKSGEPLSESRESEAEEVPLSTEDIDRAFYQAFLYAIYDAKKNGSPPHYGIDFPILPSNLIAQMVQPFLPIYHPSDSQIYTIKRTSWKNTKKFIKHLDRQLLAKSKDRNGGETVIIDVDFEDERVTTFTPYRLPKPKNEGISSAGDSQTTSKGNTGVDPSVGQVLILQNLVRASSKLVPDLLPSKTEFYTPSQVTSYLRTYLENHPELTSQSSSARFVKLDPFLANNILGSNPGPADSKALAVGEIARDALQKRVLDDHNLCTPYWVLLRNGQKWSSSDSSLPKPKSGASPKVSVTIEKRTGTKTVTKVGNVGVFGINADLLAGELQKKCASSTSVGQLMGGKPGVMEVLVQGDQRDGVEKEMSRRGVDRRWIEVVDKTKKKGGAGGGGSGGGGGRR